eukprot:Transcript_4917.p2 GENE.Transcript_4917~~Transcript_4917.p2  ORF type:complete len:285 (-),score=94.02 Transcript_4917:281-1093(-)
MSLATEAACSAAAGVTSTCLGHPLDCVKVRLQTAKPGLTTLGCASEMLRTGGLGAFAKGLSPPLANAVLLNTVMFVAFAEAQRRLPQDTLGSLLAGGVAGVAQAFLTTPLDWLKIQAQLSAAVGGGSSSALLLQTLRRRPGLLYLGHSMNLLREAAFTACYLGLYARIRHALAPGDARMPLSLVAAVSATTGALAWLVCYPFDVVKSVQQAQPPAKPGPLSSIGGAARHVWAQGGWRGFYRGAAASTARAVLVTCSRLVAYEQAKAVLTS